MSALDGFHPAVAAWFRQTFDAPTAAQALAWPAIQAGRHVLVAAPTGSGKTFAAFLAAIDQLVRQGLTAGLADETQVLYVSPLKALSNDIQRNLQGPLEGIRDELAALGLPDAAIRTVVRTGDTSPKDRARFLRHPGDILITTPESLYLLLTSRAADALRSTLALARHAEAHGYRRFWLAEHHNMPGIASAAAINSGALRRRMSVIARRFSWRATGYC